MEIKLKYKDNKDKFIFRTNYVGEYFTGWSIGKYKNDYCLILDDKGRDYEFFNSGLQDLYKS